MRAGKLATTLLSAALVVLAACEGGPPSGIDDRRVVVISVTPPSPSVAVGATVQLTATARDVNSDIVPGATFVWSSFNVGVATVDSDGLVTGVAAGNAIVDARIPGVAVTAGSASVTVTAAAAEAPDR